MKCWCSCAYCFVKDIYEAKTYLLLCHVLFKCIYSETNSLFLCMSLSFLFPLKQISNMKKEDSNVARLQIFLRVNKVNIFESNFWYMVYSYMNKIQMKETTWKSNVPKYRQHKNRNKKGNSY